MIKRKNLAKLALIGSMALSFSRCEEKPKEYVNLQGTVFSERYMPASAGFVNMKSRYSFSIDTEYGRKAIQVRSIRAINKESIDALIEKGTKVEIQNIMKNNLDKQVYYIKVNRIKVLD